MLRRRLLIVTGKGGAGRSAVTAAIALRAARTGKRVLAIAMTAPTGLAEHLGVETLGYEPRAVRAGVSAMAVERPAALDEYLHIQLRVPRQAPMGAIARGLSVFVDTVPGIRDVITIGKVLYEVHRGTWDLVVADAPPSGQIMSYLRAPRTIAGLVPAGRVRAQAEWMEEILSNPDQAGLILVTLPSELPTLETLTTLAALDDEPIVGIAGVVANRVLPDAGDVPDPDDLPSGAHRDALALHVGLSESQDKWLGRLPDGPYLPYLFGLLTPGEVAARLADELVVR